MVFTLSSAAKKSTLSMAKDLEHCISTRKPSQSAIDLKDLAHTLSSRRSALSWRMAVTASSSEELVRELSQPDLKPLFAAPDLNIGFIFTGQGAQWPRMGRELIEVYPTFKESLVAAESHFKSLGAEWFLIGM
jgi:acyl transferase domain-containing protein